MAGSSACAAGFVSRTPHRHLGHRDSGARWWRRTSLWRGRFGLQDGGQGGLTRRVWRGHLPAADRDLGFPRKTGAAFLRSERGRGRRGERGGLGGGGAQAGRSVSARTLGLLPVVLGVVVEIVQVVPGAAVAQQGHPPVLRQSALVGRGGGCGRGRVPVALVAEGLLVTGRRRVTPMRGLG